MVHIWRYTNWIISGLGNGFLPIWHHDITWTNADLYSAESRRKYVSKISTNIKNFFQENAFESVICQIAAILFKSQCIKSSNMQQTI